METRVLTAHVPSELADKLDQLAKQMDRPRGWIVKQALAAWIEDEEERDRLTREAMAQVRAGRAIEHSRVKEWVASLGTPDPLPRPD